MRPHFWLLCVLLTALAARGASAQSANLLQNPGFEDGFYRWNGINELAVGNGWTPWWIENPNSNPAYLRPEFKHAKASEFAYRVHSGQSAQQWFKLHSSFLAGLYQQVFGVQSGETYRFTAWAQVWSSAEDNPATVSTMPANPRLQVGIDPTGNWDPFASSVVWSGEAGMNQVIDNWGLVAVEAVAQSDVITVFVRSRPDFANKHNNVYIDDTSLSAIGPPAPTAPPPTATEGPPTETPVLPPPSLTPTPLPPTIPPVDTVTAAATASPLPATATLSPTMTASATVAPTDTPTSTASATATSTVTPSPTTTPTASATATPTDTPTPLPSATPPATEVAALEPTVEGEEAAETADGPLCLSPAIGAALLLGMGLVIDGRRRSRS